MIAEGNPQQTELFERSRPERLLRWLMTDLRPALGWGVLLCSMVLAWLPGEVALSNNWLQDAGRSDASVVPVGVIAVLITWLLLGWSADQLAERPSFTVGLARALVLLGSGILVISQSLLGWIPGAGLLWRTAMAGAWSALWGQIQTDFVDFGVRMGRWWAGVLAGGATQDDLVFALFAATILWLVGIAIAWIARHSQRGFLASLPSLWLLATMILYGGTGRWPLVVGLLFAIALQVLLDQFRLEARWRLEQIDYSPGLFLDRALYSMGAAILVLGLALLFPSVSIPPLAERYMALVAPIDRGVEDMGQRLFPDLRASSRFRGSTIAGGLPNDFLLGAGPELSLREVMRVRTDEPFTFIPEAIEEIPAPGHYIRGGTLALYDGLGWSNPSNLQRKRRTVDAASLDESPPAPQGRRLVKQDIFLTFGSQILYAAPEPVSPTEDFRAEARAEDDLVAMWTGQPGQSVRSYTVSSAVPALSTDELAALKAWGADNPLPEEYAVHLALPDTITERTRQLAARLTTNLDSPYAKAEAIEKHLRSIEYDLTVSKPPGDVVDVADYFLFDLQRGYCDYYATAFIIMARLEGLPARFATGFAPGIWSASEGMRIVTEAQAHSWPEVYFPDYGWIPFEPTAGLPSLERIGLAAPVVSSGAVASQPSEPTALVEEPASDWNWQMLVWLLPVGLLLWWGVRLYNRWHERREDPWESLVRWGAQRGHPPQAGETVLEYGASLSAFTLARQQSRQDAGRRVAREVVALSEEVASMLYDHGSRRDNAAEKVAERWRGLRGYLRTVK